MDHLIWKLKQLFRNLIPLLLLGLVLFGGFRLYKNGTFRQGLKPGINHLLTKIPYFGSRFRHEPATQVVVVQAQTSKGKRLVRVVHGHKFHAPKKHRHHKAHRRHHG